MKKISFETWKRRKHYEFFKDVDIPQYNVCLNINVTNFLKFVKQNNISFYYSMIYICTYNMNEMEEFRYKIRDKEIILYDKLHPTFTDMTTDENLFKIVRLEMQGDIIEFANAAKHIANNQFYNSKFEHDEIIAFSCVPWISFTSILNEIMLNKEDSVPKIIFGKYFDQEDKILLPVSIEVNHKLIDGIHLGKYIENLQQHVDKF